MITIHDDVVVVGGGPAGLHAASEAARAGASVTLIDEQPAPGGQIYRALPEAFRVTDASSLGDDFANRRRVVDDFGRARVRTLCGALAWGWADDRVLDVVQGRRTLRVGGTSVILATGAHDRPTPLPGWTLPGVVTVGGAQTLLKSQRLLVGRRILLAGTGPLLLVVAAQLARAGADIVAVADPVSRAAVLPHAAALAAAWPLAVKGMGYHFSLLRRGVRWMSPWLLMRVDGESEVSGAVLARVDRDWCPVPGTERHVEVDTVCVGYGLVPDIALVRAASAAVDYNASQDVWIPRRSLDGETSVPGVFAVGDGAGVAGVIVAADEGRVAGIVAASRAGRLSSAEAEARLAAPLARLGRLRRFRRAMDEVYAVRAGLRALVTPDTVVCRCEEVIARDIDAAIDDGACTIQQVKSWTRAGMGPCQGRMCGLPTMGRVADRARIAPSDVGFPTARPPVRPVPIDVLIDPARDEDSQTA